MREPTFHVLLIGADYYFPNVLSNGATFASLNGSVNDVQRMEKTLTARLAGRRLSITKLLAPNEGGSSPGGDETKWPTAANIRKALADLAELAQPGDQVLIHYSGHGGRVITAWEESKGGDGIDEALVPIDVGVPDTPGDPPFTRAERYIRDVELAVYLDRLAQKTDETKKGVVVTLIFDSCHSGGSTRGIEVARRSASGGTATDGDPSGTLDRRHLPPGKLPMDSQRMLEAFQRLAAGATRSAAAAASWLPPAKGYVLLAACRDVESALEASIDGRPRGGVLTDALIEALNAIGTEQSWKTIYDRILARVRGRFPAQTPQLLGEIERHVFGVDLLPVEQTLLVREIDAGDRTVRIDAGLASTITEGTEVDIYRPGETDFAKQTNRVASAKVTQAFDLDSLALLDPSADPRAVQVGAPVVIRSLPLRRAVKLIPRSSVASDPASQHQKALDAVADAISTTGKGFLKVCGAKETPHYQVVVTESGHYEIWDPQGNPYLYLDPVIATGEEEEARALVAQLRRLGQYFTVLELQAPPSVLLDQLEIELLVAPPGWDGDRNQPTSPVGGTPLERTGDSYSVKSVTWLWLRIKNKRPKEPVNIAVLVLDRKWNVWVLVPNQRDIAGKKYETVSDQAATFAFKMSAPIPETLDVLKLFMTTGDVDFRWLATTKGTTRSMSPATTSLGLLLEAISEGKGRTRDAESPASGSSASWALRDFRIRTFQ